MSSEQKVIPASIDELTGRLFPARTILVEISPAVKLQTPNANAEYDRIGTPRPSCLFYNATPAEPETVSETPQIYLGTGLGRQ